MVLRDKDRPPDMNEFPKGEAKNGEANTDGRTENTPNAREEIERSGPCAPDCSPWKPGSANVGRREAAKDGRLKGNLHKRKIGQAGRRRHRARDEREESNGARALEIPSEAHKVFGARAGGRSSGNFSRPARPRIPKVCLGSFPAGPRLRVSGFTPGGFRSIGRPRSRRSLLARSAACFAAARNCELPPRGYLLPPGARGRSLSFSDDVQEFREFRDY